MMAALLVWVTGGCGSGTNPLEGTPPPGQDGRCQSSIDAVVYWPIYNEVANCEGLVRGVLPASLRSEGGLIRVTADATGAETILRTSDLGRLDFSICASAQSSLSVATCRSVPCSSDWILQGQICALPTPLPLTHSVCCQPQGTCASPQALECPSASAGGFTCNEDRDCDAALGLTTVLEASSLSWSASSGALSAAPGSLPPSDLVIVSGAQAENSALVKEDGSFRIVLSQPGPVQIVVYDQQGIGTRPISYTPRSE